MLYGLDSFYLSSSILINCPFASQSFLKACIEDVITHQQPNIFNLLIIGGVANQAVRGTEAGTEHRAVVTVGVTQHSLTFWPHPLQLGKVQLYYSNQDMQPC